MRINHNIASLNTYRQLSANSANGQKSLEKLSSGLRINRAGDDAAGLAISEKMRGQIRGLDQASRNAQDGISMIQTAEGALSETHSILQRMRELAVQSSNGTQTDADRGEIQKEISQLKDEINRISDTTEFNTKKLLNGSSGVTGSVTAGGANGAFINGSESTLTGTFVVTIGTAATKAGAAQSAAIATTDFSAKQYIINGVTIDTSSLTASNAAGLAAKINTYSGQTGVTAAEAGTKITLSQANYGSSYTVSLTGTHAGEIGGAVTAGVDAKISVTKADGSTADAANIVGNGKVVTVGGGYDSSGLSVRVDGLAAATFTLQVTQGSVGFQIGANKGQDMSLSIGNMSSTQIGDVAAGNYVSGMDASTQTGAKDAISVVDKAIAMVSAERSKLGAVQNRLEHTINNLGTTSENLSASESRIRDVDMAKEMMEFTKNNILTQAAQSMLAQANQAPQGVLQLLR